MTKLSQALRYFLLEERRPQTNHFYTIVLGMFSKAVDVDADRALESIRFEELADYFAAEKKRGLKPATLATYIAVVKAFFAWTVAHGYLTESPARMIKRSSSASTASARSRAIPADELRKILKCAERTRPRDYALLLFLADTGCRAGGAASLTLDNLDLLTHDATLFEKGGKRHRALFGDETAAALTVWLTMRPDAGHDFVWTGPGPDHLPISAQNVSDVVRRLAVRTGASRKWGAHSIRHAVGEALAKNGVAVSTIQMKLGHADPNITMKFYLPKDITYLRQVSDTYALAALGELEPPPVPPPVLISAPPLPFIDLVDRLALIDQIQEGRIEWVQTAPPVPPPVLIGGAPLPFDDVGRAFLEETTKTAALPFD